MNPGATGQLARGCATAIILLLAAALHPAAARAATGGTLTVRITGLPAGQRPDAQLSGPGIRHHLHTAALTIRHARPGRYLLRLHRVELARTTGPVKRGALAYPAAVATVRVTAGRSARITGRYGTIINPGVVTLGHTVISARGDPSGPSAVVLAGARSFAPGAVLSAAPSAILPRGLLAHVRSARTRGSRTTVTLTPASPYEVMPVADFNIPLHPAPTAHASALPQPCQAGQSTGCVKPTTQCGPAIGVTVKPQVTNIRFSGGWNTVPFLGHDVKLGVRAHVDFDAGTDVELTGPGVQCSLEVSYSENGLIGVIPITAGIYGSLTASAEAGAKITTGGTVHVRVGADTIGVPPALLWFPQANVSDPRFRFHAEKFKQASAGIELGVKAGLGNDNVASLTLHFADSLDFTASSARNCSWDANLGKFYPEGKLGDLTITTPKTLALYRRNLYRCNNDNRPEPVVLTNPGDQVGSVHVPVGLPMQASAPDGGTLTYDAPVLPHRLQIDKHTGLISGIPDTPGITSVGVTVYDSKGTNDTVTFNWAIFPYSAQPELILENPGDRTGTVDSDVSLQLKAASSDKGTITYKETGLPPDLHFDEATGLISGKLTASGTYPVTITVSEPGATGASIQFKWTVTGAPPPQLGPVTPIQVRQMPGSAWSVGINDGALAIPAPGNRVIASTCESTKDLATDPLVQMIEQNGTVDWAAPAGVPNTSWGCPPVVTDKAGNTYFETLASLTTYTTFEFVSADPAGHVRWVQPAPNTYDGLNPVIGANGVVYFVTRTDYGNSRVNGYDTATGRQVLTNLSFFDLMSISTYAGGLAFVDLNGGDYAPVVDYYGYDGTLQHSYPASAAVSANNGTWSFAVGPDGQVLISGTPTGTTCATAGSTATFSVQRFTPAGSAWLWSDDTPATCSGGSALAPDTTGGAYIATGNTDAQSTSLQRIDSTHTRLWIRQIDAPALIERKIVVDTNGTATVARRWSCPAPESCTGSEISFFTSSGAQAAPKVDIDDPQYISYYSGIDDFTVGTDSLYVTRGAGDYHEETGSISRFQVTGLGPAYQLSIAAG
jgi:hypothetical protein